MIDIVNSVKHYQPVFWDVDNSRLLESNRSNIEYNNQANAAAQQASIELSSAINDLDLNEKDQYIKNDLYNELETMTNNVLQSYGGNIKYAMQDISNMSKKIISDPNIAGRIDSNRRHREYIESIKSRDDINDDVKQMIIEKNPYTFTPIYKKDSDGNDTNEIETYERWKPSKYAVKQISDKELISTALGYITHDQSNITIPYFYTKKENGGYERISNINNVDITKPLFYIDETNNYVRLEPEMLWKGLYQAMEDPTIRASLKQDYELAVWKSDKDINNPYKHLYGYYTKEGDTKTPTEYIFDRFSNFVDTYSFEHNTHSKSIHKNEFYIETDTFIPKAAPKRSERNTGATIEHKDERTDYQGNLDIIHAGVEGIRRTYKN